MWISLHLHGNNISKMSQYNTFQLLRYAHLRLGIINLWHPKKITIIPKNDQNDYIV